MIYPSQMDKLLISGKYKYEDVVTNESAQANLTTLFV